jgi:hypothetical protein
MRTMTPSNTETDITLIMIVLVIVGLSTTVAATLITLKRRVKRRKPDTKVKVES